MKKISTELKDKSLNELREEEALLKEEIGKLRLESRVSPPKDTNILIKKRKRLAALLTIASEKRKLEILQKVTK